MSRLDESMLIRVSVEGMRAELINYLRSNGMLCERIEGALSTEALRVQTDAAINDELASIMKYVVREVVHEKVAEIRPLLVQAIRDAFGVKGTE